MPNTASHRTRAASMVGACALLAACAGDQAPAPVDYRGSAPAAAAQVAPAPAVNNTPDERGVIVNSDYAMAVARSGDTLDSIAARTGAAAEDIAAYNGLPAGYRPRAGDELVLPPKIGGYARTVAPALGPVSAAPTAAVTPLYQASPLSEPVPVAPAPAQAQDGWSAARIADAISSAPATGASDIIYHEVRAGETLYAVSRQYGVPVDTLAQWNALTGPSYEITQGQVLTVPVTAGTIIGAANPVETPGAGTAPPPPPSVSAPLPPDTRPVVPIASPGLGAYQETTRQTATLDAPTIDTPHPPARAEAIPVTPIPEAAKPAPAATASGGMRLVPPVNGPVAIPYNRTAGPTQNDGVDFTAVAGAPVTAAADGTVALVSTSLGDWGSIVLLRHGAEYMTVYGRLGAVHVAKGQEVRQGDPIGSVAEPRDGSRPLMHFEVRRGAFSEDPETFF
ncbi:MAG: lipoprotein NlpD [Paracoccaceae bacterium]|jgi:lipoprotein NlpD